MKKYLKQTMSFIKMSSSHGFTLVQLIIAMSIISILASAVIFSGNVISRKGNAQDVKRWEDITAIAKAIELYQIDNDALPADLASANIGAGHKVVLCSSAATLSCDGQDRACLVLNDADFFGTYIGSLPIDPEKSADTDTGYYISRTGDMLTLGSCSSNSSTEISYVAKARLGAYSATCGDGLVEGDEVCDDGDTFNEGCLNGLQETAGTYCNAICSAQIVISVNEACDSIGVGGCYDDLTTTQYYDLTQASKACGTYDYCSSDCSSCVVGCLDL